MSEDVSVERLSVAEAAQVLSVTRDAIHKRISWGSIEHERGEDGRFCVYVDTSTLGLASSTGTSQNESKVEALERLIENQQDQIAYLRTELARRAETYIEESRRKDSIIAALTQQIPELEAPRKQLPSQKPPESPQTPQIKPERAEPAEPAEPGRAEPERVEPERIEPERAEPRPATGRPREEGTQRSWWHRVFGE